MGNRMWKIRESYGDRSQEFDTPEEQEAYECGYEEGYEAAMEESQMGERYGSRNYGNRVYGARMMGERRRRDSMGRFR